MGKILNKVTDDDKEKGEEKEKQKLRKDMSTYAQAFKMLKDIKPLTDVAIELDIDTDTVIYFYNDYLILVNMKRLVIIYRELKDDLSLFLHLYKRIKIDYRDHGKLVFWIFLTQLSLDIIIKTWA